MKQIATVKEMHGQNVAEVTVVRRSACAHDCANCAGCAAQVSTITVRAQCPLPVAPGDKVELYSDNRVLGYAVLVYLVPLILFLAGYVCLPGAAEMVRGLCAAGGFALGIALAVVCDRVVRRKNATMYRIVRKL